MPNSRFDSIDALRGVAILWMTVFHLCFDLSHFGYIKPCDHKNVKILIPYK